ncbi:SurA N-terminal domain-containing protein [Oryzibacter oryziterrae]|uniref:SurA N-terminal domain-containing protein n=1 Tax=Oryzibacter oryziterrae TaxID=2766474 RepID=UPI001F2C436C|nr:SurA N-terminal domain-containing protein [Oryzibacter oryziterrae]
MLDTLRRGANTLVAKILLGLLTLSFIGWGVGSRLGNVHSDTIATVGGTSITLGEFQRTYQRQAQAFSKQLGQPVTADLAKAFGLPQQVLARLMSTATLDDTAAALGLGLSDDKLAKLIADDPAFKPQGATAFDRAYFQALLRQNGLTEEAYVKERRSQALGDQLAQGLVDGLTTPKAMVEAVYRFQNQVRTVDYLTLARAQVEPIGKPADDVLAKWFDTKKSNFKAPEFRSLTVVAVTPEAVSDPSTVSDADARKEYERTKSQYEVAERRHIQQILYTSDAEAAAAVAKLKSGATFDQLITDKGAKPEDVDLGVLTKDKVLDPAVAEAAFKLALNVPSDPVKSTFGPVLVRVTEIDPAQVKPFEEVSADIRKALATKSAETAVLETHDEVEDALAGGATLKEVADRFKLKLQTFEVDPDGNGTDGSQVADIPEEQKLLAAGFAAGEGDENDPLQLDHGFIWYEVTKVTPGRERTLDEVKDKAVAAWTDEEAQNRLKKKATDMVDAIKAGKPIADLAKDAGVEVQTADNITRNSDDVGLGKAGVAESFRGPQGTVATVEGLDGTRVVLVVSRVVDPAFIADAGDAVDIQSKMAEELQKSLFAQYVGAAQDSLGTTVNQSMVDAVIGANGAN